MVGQPDAVGGLGESVAGRVHGRGVHRQDDGRPAARAGGLHSCTIEVLDQRGVADRFLARGQVAQVAGFAGIPLDIGDFPTRHNYGLALWQNYIERTLVGWVGELAVPISYGSEVTRFAQDDTGVAVALSDGRSLRADYLVGCDGGRSLIRKAAGIAFPGWDPTTSNLIAEVEPAEEPEWGIRRACAGWLARPWFFCYRGLRHPPVGVVLLARGTRCATPRCRSPRPRG